MKNFKIIISTLTIALSASFQTYGGEISGRITCEGKGISGVSVSDGYVVTTTTSDGSYTFDSDKKNGYVFYTIPAGYEPLAKKTENAFAPSFWAKLKNHDSKAAETHDFTLRKVDNDKFSMVIGADIHLANRVKDVEQFNDLFMTSLHRLTKSHPERKIYSMFLGDISWDAHWYRNKYDLKSVKRTLAKADYPVLLFPTMGNHDNDPATPADGTTDFNASEAFRSIMAPNYYSFNIGKIHFVMLDNIVYKNNANPKKKFNKGVVGERNYEASITPEQIEWLKKDLANVADKTTPVVIGMHIPSWRLDAANNFVAVPRLKNGSNEALADAVKDFSRVILVSGHMHYNFHAHPADHTNITENNIAAVCATWWNTERLSARHIGNDGAPGGYALYDFNGKDIKWKYIPIDRVDSVGNRQFRVYDMNTVRNLYQADERALKLIAHDSKRVDFSKIGDNHILVNVFNYDNDWKVEIIENGKPLKVKRVLTEDPLHTLCFDLPTFKANGWKLGSGTIRNSHTFEAVATEATTPIKVKVTDSFGNVYEEALNRPKAFTTEMN